MILLDTNVVSEPLRPAPHPAVVGWLDAQAPETLFLSTVSLAELLVGVARLPDGRRKTHLETRLEATLTTLFAGRILAFDRDAAACYAAIVTEASRNGEAIGFADGQIASIAKARSFAVATRDTAPFHAAGLEVINPFSKQRAT